jgi:hypothetical protein
MGCSAAENALPLPLCATPAYTADSEAALAPRRKPAALEPCPVLPASPAAEDR